MAIPLIAHQLPLPTLPVYCNLCHSLVATPILESTRHCLHRDPHHRTLHHALGIGLGLELEEGGR